ncbi:DUF2795 domain-containing protein [Catellatospora tritici]|uniref:DUF2795 domain-containing protein n=1 Tax=Catellatospora tritici TaxID=2851566 RepID=UPI001C2D492D|nr:DUF2795 domain-containing protein [Catellatospora tritici]MBV1853680.1 DUF2795 domain-containing protein [Catellatospora tritici]
MTQTPDYGAGQRTREHDELDPRTWDAPGRNAVVGDDERDPDRRELRALIGQYVSLAGFPADGRRLAQYAADQDAPEPVLEQLGTLEPDRSFETARDLWLALDLEAETRF